MIWARQLMVNLVMWKIHGRYRQLRKLYVCTIHIDRNLRRFDLSTTKYGAGPETYRIDYNLHENKC